MERSHATTPDIQELTLILRPADRLVFESSLEAHYSEKCWPLVISRWAEINLGGWSPFHPTAPFLLYERFSQSVYSSRNFSASTHTHLFLHKKWYVCMMYVVHCFILQQMLIAFQCSPGVSVHPREGSTGLLCSIMSALSTQARYWIHLSFVPLYSLPFSVC